MNKSLNTKLLSLVLTLSLVSGSAYAMNLQPTQNEPDLDLLDACKDNCLESIKGALDKGANPNARTEDGLTALHLMTRHSANPTKVLPMLDGVKALLAKGADINAMAIGATPLHVATNTQCLPLVELLMSNNADAALCSFNNQTPLQWSLSGILILKELVESDPFFKTPINIKRLNDGYLITGMLAVAQEKGRLKKEELEKAQRLDKTQHLEDESKAPSS